MRHILCIATAAGFAVAVPEQLLPAFRATFKRARLDPDSGYWTLLKQNRRRLMEWLESAHWQLNVAAVQADADSAMAGLDRLVQTLQPDHQLSRQSVAERWHGRALMNARNQMSAAGGMAVRHSPTDTEYEGLVRRYYRDIAFARALADYTTLKSNLATQLEDLARQLRLPAPGLDFQVKPETLVDPRIRFANDDGRDE